MYSKETAPHLHSRKEMHKLLKPMQQCFLCVLTQNSKRNPSLEMFPLNNDLKILRLNFSTSFGNSSWYIFSQQQPHVYCLDNSSCQYYNIAYNSREFIIKDAHVTQHRLSGQHMKTQQGVQESFYSGKSWPPDFVSLPYRPEVLKFRTETWRIKHRYLMDGGLQFSSTHYALYK